MSKKQKVVRPKARLPKGLRDVLPDEIRPMQAMLRRIEEVYALYGFEPLDTPAFEYSDALGKFLPDDDRPNEGVFSFEDEDGQWVSLRYDLTAPLARYVAENYDGLPKPFRRYQTGDVFRNEKPGPGRYRQFRQFDADTVGTANVAADAEICMLAAETLEHLGIARGDFRIRVNNRKVLDGVLASAGIDPMADNAAQMRTTVLRAIDKLDRLGPNGVALLLGDGRKDESGDFTKGAGLGPEQIERILAFTALADSVMGSVDQAAPERVTILAKLETLVGDVEIGREGVAELAKMDALMTAAGFGADRIVVDTSIVRGLDYYTGPVFEAELTFAAEDDDGQIQRFGSVGGGGRYDGLVARFKGVEVPATGFSIGVSRLATALKALGKLDAGTALAPVVVLVMDMEQTERYQAMVQELRTAGIRAELYLGTAGMKAQMKYADRRSAPCVVIEGEDERANGQVTLKDLREGKRLSETIEDRSEWKDARPAQVAVARNDLVAEIHKILAREQ